MTDAPYPTIVCCVDRSDASRAVEHTAVALADAVGATLRILHVMRPPPAFTGGMTTRSAPAAVLEDRLREEAVAWLRTRVEPHEAVEPVLLEAAFPGEAICEWARHHPASLLMVGRCEKRHPFALGSTATYLSMHAPCDVLLVQTPTA